MIMEVIEPSNQTIMNTLHPLPASFFNFFHLCANMAQEFTELLGLLLQFRKVRGILSISQEKNGGGEGEYEKHMLLSNQRQFYRILEQTEKLSGLTSHIIQVRLPSKFYL